MAGIQIGRLTIGSPDGWVFERQDGGGELYTAQYQSTAREGSCAFYLTRIHVSIEDAPRVEAWLLGTPAKPTLPDDVREYLRMRVREWGCVSASDLLAKYPKEA